MSVQPELDALVEYLAKLHKIPPAQVRHIMRQFSVLVCDKLEERIGFHTENAKRAVAVLHELDANR